MNTPLTRDVPTPYGTYARGCPITVLETNPGYYVVNLGLERHPIHYPMPAAAFAHQPRPEPAA